MAFDFPEWYGKNWDAFWDLLWSDCDADKVIIKGENTLPDHLNEEVSIMHRVLEDNVKFRETYQLEPFLYELV